MFDLQINSQQHSVRRIYKGYLLKAVQERYKFQLGH